MSNALKHIFLTSDHHFGSYRLPSFFQVNSKEQEQELIDKWNLTIGKNDLVYYNGDFCDGNVHELQDYASKLNGQIILIRGNHDVFPDDVYKAVFKDVVDSYEIKNLDLTIHHCPGEVKTKYEAFGHLHRKISKNLSSSCKFHTSVMFNNGFPVSLEQVMMHFSDNKLMWQIAD